ncbi:MAG TPA: hypothetical protein PK857_03095 [Hyphomicrobium sp.]|nr:hypothetical protein [Hyphomicrobium sp.]
MPKWIGISGLRTQLTFTSNSSARGKPKMPSFRMTSSNPFWFEDLVFLVMDESRRLPERASAAFARARRTVEAGAAAVVRMKPLVVRQTSAPAKAVPVAAAVVRTPAVARIEANLLDEPLSWALATEPLVSGVKGVERAVELHEKAREQLGAITYVLDRMRDELSPALTQTRLEQKAAVDDAALRLDTSIEALLALSRKNAATRPKDRILTAA